MLTQAIILAGGLGSRLAASLPGLPKCLAPVNGRPFLFILIDELRQQGIRQFYFSLGYGADQVIEALRSGMQGTEWDHIVEGTALGTGGAIRNAGSRIEPGPCLVVNGDSLFRVSIPELTEVHMRNQAECTLAIKKVQDTTRFGKVEMEGEQVISFGEKEAGGPGLINGGVYLLETGKFLAGCPDLYFSFEKEYLEKKVSEGRFFGLVSDGYFIDIGTPEDYQRAKAELK